MRILVTGGFGNVGRSTVAACLSAGHEVGILESPSALRRAGASIRKLLRRSWSGCRISFGDIRNPQDVRKAFALFPEGPEAVIHLAALIPPAADKNPELTVSINVEGTSTLLKEAASLPRPPRFVMASSIAIYGDRVKDFWISSSDKLSPTDLYGRTKVECETRIRNSGLDFAILRLSYVTWAKWLPFDPLLFAMPPETRIEIIHTEDAGRAFAAAAAEPGASRGTFDIGGGPLCRTSFRAFIDRIFRYYGLGNSSFLEDGLFATRGFHCGWYEDSDHAESVLRFRRKTLEDFYEEVRWETRAIAPLAFLAAPLVKRWLKKKSPLLARAQPRRAEAALARSRQ